MGYEGNNGDGKNGGDSRGRGENRERKMGDRSVQREEMEGLQLGLDRWVEEEGEETKAIIEGDFNAMTEEEGEGCG